MNITTSKKEPAPFPPRSITIEFTSQREIDTLTSLFGGAPGTPNHYAIFNELKALGGRSTGTVRVTGLEY